MIRYLFRLAAGFEGFLRCLGIGLLFSLPLSAAAPANTQQKENSMPAGITEILNQRCSDCHDAETKKGGIYLENLNLTRDSFETWVRVYDAVASGEMPPRKKTPLEAKEKQALLSALKQTLEGTEQARNVGSGRSQIRRLNRVEYETLLRDLLGLPLLRVKDLLPEDGQQFGFDKAAGALDISPVQMTKYMQASDLALHMAVVRAETKPESKAWHANAFTQDSVRAALAVHCAVPLNGGTLAEGLSTHIVGDPVGNYGNCYRGAQFSGKADSVAVLTGVIGAHQPEGIQPDGFRPTIAGMYKMRFSAWGLRWERTQVTPAKAGTVRQFATFDKPFFKDEKNHWQATPREAEAALKPSRERIENIDFYGEGEMTHVVRVSLKGEPIGYFDIPSLKPTVHEFSVWLNPGDKISFHAMTLPSSGAANSAHNQGVRDYEGPAIAYDWFEAEGPINAEWPPQSQRSLFGKMPVSRMARPFLKNAPTVEEGATLRVSPNVLKGAGIEIGGERLLNTNGRASIKINFPAAGEYEVALGAYETPAGTEPAMLRLLSNETELPHARFKVDARRAQPKTFTTRLRVGSSGPSELSVEFLNDFLDEANPDPERRDRNVYLTSLEISPRNKASTSAVEEGAETANPRSLLSHFAARAFRRPVTEGEVEPFVGLVEAELTRGESMEEALISGYKAVLCAPEFLLTGFESGVPRSERKGLGPLGPHALASRLSLFLWNSGPDAPLGALADSGRLVDSATLRAQVRRMLEDPRSERFVQHFLDEWLELKKIDFTTPDSKLYPEFDPWLRDSMVEETRAFFRSLLSGNLSVRNVIDSKKIFVNQRLAQLYGIRGVYGAEMKAIEVPEHSGRGGMLTQAAVLKVTANGTATSPVLRGVWVTERLLGEPRRQPPPNIPAIEPDATGAETIRQMIEKHREDSACAGCHARMDPPGMALESFDVLGGLRDRYRLAGEPKKKRVGKELVEDPFVEVISDASPRNRVKLRLGSPVDASGKLADGRSFENVQGLRELLLADEDLLASNFVRQLLVYATGAGIGFSDRPAVEAIVARTKAGGHGVRSIIEEVVVSDLFRSK